MPYYPPPNLAQRVEFALPSPLALNFGSETSMPAAWQTSTLQSFQGAQVCVSNNRRGEALTSPDNDCHRLKPLRG